MVHVQKLSLREVDHFRGRADDRLDVFLFDFLSILEPALKVLDLFLDVSKEPEGIRNQTLMTRGRAEFSPGVVSPPPV